MATKKSNKQLWIMLALIIVVVAAILLLPSCGSRSGKAAADTESTTLVKAGEKAPDFTVEMFDGGKTSLAELKGKVVLLNFWATWCPPCVQELPLLNAFYGEHRAKGWQVLGLAIDQPANVQKFLQRMPLDFPVVLGGLGGAELSRGLGNDKGGLPFTVMFAADGSISKRKIGQLTEKDLESWFKSV